MAHDGRRWPYIVSNMRPRGVLIATRRPDAATEPAKEPPERQKSSKNLVFFNDFWLACFFLPMGFGGPKTAPMRLMLGPPGFNMAPRWRQDGPMMAQ